MTKLLLVLLSALAGSVVTVLVLGLQPTASAGGGLPPCSSQNGDVNADGRLDLSDPITLLGNLFLGTPAELLPLCTPQAAHPGLPDTGQTRCYNVAGVEIPCDSATCPGQDGFYATGCPGEGRFSDNGDGTVTDNCTGLMWQKNTADINSDGQFDPLDSREWCFALTYCEDLSFAGHDDWRLPNARELQSLVDHGRFGPAIDPVFGSLLLPYWSSTVSAAGVAGAWVMAFYDGKSTYEGKSSAFPVRAVRSAP